MLGGRPLQNLAADLHADARSDLKSWTIDRLDFRAPGATQVSLSGTTAQPGPSGGFKGALASNHRIRIRWWRGCRAAAEITYRSQKPFAPARRCQRAADRVAIDAMQAEIDGGAVAGRLALSTQSAKQRARGSMPS